MKQQIRTLQFMRAFMALAVVVYAFIGEKISRAKPPANMTFFYVIVLTAILVAAIAVFLRARTKPLDSAILADQSQLVRWRTGHIAAYALALAVALYGLVVRVIGVTSRQAFPFYILGFVLILMLPPKISDRADTNE